MYIKEYDEEKILTLFEQTGIVLRKLKFDLEQICSRQEYVKSSTVLELCAKIEDKQREYARLDDMLTEMENAF